MNSSKSKEHSTIAGKWLQEYFKCSLFSLAMAICCTTVISDWFWDLKSDAVCEHQISCLLQEMKFKTRKPVRIDCKACTVTGFNTEHQNWHILASTPSSYLCEQLKDAH